MPVAARPLVQNPQRKNWWDGDGAVDLINHRGNHMAAALRSLLHLSRRPLVGLDDDIDPAPISSTLASDILFSDTNPLYTTIERGLN